MSNTCPRVTSSVDTICRALSEDIFSMRFPPGTKITEAILCSRYGVSRNTLREALTRLLSHGLLVKVPNKSIYVRTLNYTDVKEIFRLRELLELEAIRNIMARGNIPPELAQLAEHINENVTEDNWDANTEADIKFHSQLVASASSSCLQRLYSTIFAEIKLVIYRSRHIVPINPDNNIHHRKLLTAIENDDLESAQQLLSEHIHKTVECYRAMFEAEEVAI